MATITLAEAARRAGTSKKVLLRAIRSGRVPAARLVGGGWAVEETAAARLRRGEAPARATSGVPAGGVPTAEASAETSPRLETELAALTVYLDLESRRAARQRERSADRAAEPRSWWRRLAG